MQSKNISYVNIYCMYFMISEILKYLSQIVTFTTDCSLRTSVSLSFSFIYIYNIYVCV